MNTIFSLSVGDKKFQIAHVLANDLGEIALIESNGNIAVSIPAYDAAKMLSAVRTEVVGQAETMLALAK